MKIENKCICEHSTGSTHIECCNICGLPLQKEQWYFYLPDENSNQKLAEYVQMNFDKYWDEMGETGAENYFETATQKELIAYGQFRAFESVQNFLEGNSKFSG